MTDLHRNLEDTLTHSSTMLKSGSQDRQQPFVILASSSPRRKQLIAELSLPFVVVVSHADETVNTPMEPAAYVRTVAQRKADAVRLSLATQDKYQSDNAWIVSADTVVVVDDEILGKPQNEDDAFAMLNRLQGRTHHVFTAICLAKPDSSNMLLNHLETRVTMKPLAAETIRAYIATGEPMDKAGAYGIQGLGATLISGIEGDYFNVVGLSTSLLTDMFWQVGVKVL